MPYIPLNRIKTNLYTAGQEFILADTGQEYTGFYHSYYDGRFFTGKSPDDENTRELIISTASNNSFEETSEIQVYTSGRGLNSEELTSNWDLNLIQGYKTAQRSILEQSITLKTPQLYIYTPSNQDYQIGEIIRYFAKKTNELKYIEVDQQTYENFSNQQPGYAWEFYTTFKLPWQIAGDRQEVQTTNQNITLLTQKRLRIQGLPEFLKYDYLKFYKES